MTRDLSQADYVYLWVDGIHLGIRLDEGKLCLLVMIGVRADGRKELVALADGYRESAESWADLLRDCARRGHARPGAGDRRRGAGVLEARCGRCSRRPGRSAAGSTRSRTCSARCRSPRTRARRRPWRRSGTPRTRTHARAAVKAFAAAYGAKFPKAAAKITEDEEELLAFYDYPAEHWVHLRTTNPIVISSLN